MTYAIPAVVIGVATLALVIRNKGKYYDKIFSDEHFTEVLDWVHYVLTLGPIEDPRLEDKTAFQSLANCGFTFTRAVGEKNQFHIALSQIGTVTTHSVSSHFAFLIRETLKPNTMESDFYYTDSHIHHLIFEKEGDGEWLTLDTATVLANRAAYQPIPFRYEDFSDLRDS